MTNTVLPETQKVLRVGWVGTGPFSFYGFYISEINKYNDYNFLNMRISHIWGDDYARNYKGRPEWVKKMLDFWSGDDQSPAGLAKKNKIPTVCSDYRDMVDEVDAAMIMDYDRAYELAEPFLKKGMPIFLCSPVAVNVPECERILDLAESTGSAVHTGSFTAYMHENLNRINNVNRDKVTQFFASTTHQFYTSYANDGLEPLYWLIGKGVQRVTLIGWNGSQGYDPDHIPLSRIHLEYKPRNNKVPIQGVLTLGGFRKDNAAEWYRVYQGDRVLEGWTNKSKRELTVRDFLITLQQVLATNKAVETREDILEKLKVVIAGYKSANENNRPVSVDEIGDYRLPTVRIEKWDVIP